MFNIDDRGAVRFLLRVFATTIVGLSFSVLARATTSITVSRATAVYSSPKFENMTSYTLRVGQIVEVDNDSLVDGYRKVFIATPKGLKTGYVLDSDYRAWSAEQTDSPRRWSVWVAPIYSYLIQGDRVFTTNMNSTYSISNFTGGTLFFAGGGEYQWSSNWSAIFGVVRRTSSTSGNATEQDSGLVTKYQVDQTFIGGIGGLRYRPDGWNHWRFDGQLEYSKGESISLATLNGPPLDSSSIKLGKYFVMTGGIVYDFVLSQHWSLDPGIRAGAVLSTVPITSDLEAEIDLKYSF